MNAPTSNASVLPIPLPTLLPKAEYMKASDASTLEGDKPQEGARAGTMPASPRPKEEYLEPASGLGADTEDAVNIDAVIQPAMDSLKKEIGSTSYYFGDTTAAWHSCVLPLTN